MQEQCKKKKKRMREDKDYLPQSLTLTKKKKNERNEKTNGRNSVYLIN